MLKYSNIDEARHRRELYDYDNLRQQKLLKMVEQYQDNLSDKKSLYALHAINAARAEIDWLQRTDHSYLDEKDKFLD